MDGSSRNIRRGAGLFRGSHVSTPAKGLRRWLYKLSGTIPCFCVLDFYLSVNFSSLDWGLSRSTQLPLDIRWDIVFLSNALIDRIEHIKTRQDFLDLPCIYLLIFTFQGCLSSFRLWSFFRGIRQYQHFLCITVQCWGWFLLSQQWVPTCLASVSIFPCWESGEQFGWLD